MPNFTYANQFSPALEPVPDDVTLNERVILINEMPWQQRSDCTYEHDYYRVFDKLEQFARNVKDPVKNKAHPERNPENLIRKLVQNDLWFIVYFVMKNPLANHPFVIEACKQIQNETGNSIELWAREHFKSTIITTAKTV